MSSSKSCWTPGRVLLLTLCFIVLLVTVIIVSFTAINPIVKKVIKGQVQLEQGTDQWDRFIDLPVPFDIKLYFYEVLNPDEIQNEGAIPEVREVGPYVYTETVKKTVIGFNDDDDTVIYEQFKTVYFDQGKSGSLTENDTIFILNPPMLILSQITNVLEQVAVVGCLEKIFPEQYSTLFINITIREAVLDGYIFASTEEDLGPACNVIRDLVIKIAGGIKNIEVLRDGNGTDLGLSFAFLQFRIREPDGIYEVKRGRDDVSTLGSIVRWNETDTLRLWGTRETVNNDTCKKVRGTDSTIYPPHITKDDYFEIFSTDICRAVKITYKGTGTYKGIDGYRFGVDETVLNSSTNNPENDCYCVKRTMNGAGDPSCFLDGLVDVEPCFNAPVLLSFPHFLYADAYRQGVIGVEPPVADNHETYLLVEPNTGTPLEGKKRVQLNLVLREVPYLPFAAKLPGTVLPVIWLDEGVTLTQDLIDELNSKYFNTLKVVDGLKYGLMALLAVCVCVSGVIYFRKSKTSKR